MTGVISKRVYFLENCQKKCFGPQCCWSGYSLIWQKLHPLLQIACVLGKSYLKNLFKRYQFIFFEPFSKVLPDIF